MGQELRGAARAQPYAVVVLIYCLRCIFSDVFTHAAAAAALKGFDINLVDAVSKAVTIPVIASSGAGAPQHFTEVRQISSSSRAMHRHACILFCIVGLSTVLSGFVQLEVHCEVLGNYCFRALPSGVSVAASII
jgi:hypothetical protein